MTTFHPATRHAAKVRLALSGPSGSGKTYSALQLAKGIGGRIALIDTEAGSASLYANLVPFDVLELGPPYEPGRYQEALAAAETAGYDVVIIDSLSHEWSGQGGCLEMVDKYAAQTRNSYTAWGHVTPKHQSLLDAIQRSRCHVIGTLRSKQDYVLEEANGKKVPRKVGLAPVQREGIEYEWTVVLDLGISHYATASKDRTSLFADRPPFMVTPDTGREVASWLATEAPAAQPGAAIVTPPLPKPAPADRAPPVGAQDLGLDHWLRITEGAETEAQLADVRLQARKWAEKRRDANGWKVIDDATRARKAAIARGAAA